MCFRVRLSCCVTSSNPKDTMYCKTLLVGQTGCCDRDGYLGDNRHRHALSRCPSPCPEPSADSAGSIHLHEFFAERTLCPSSSTVSLVSTQLHQFFAEHTPYRSRRRSLHRRTCHCPCHAFQARKLPRPVSSLHPADRLYALLPDPSDSMKVSSYV